MKEQSPAPGPPPMGGIPDADFRCRNGLGIDVIVCRRDGDMFTPSGQMSAAQIDDLRDHIEIPMRCQLKAEPEQPPPGYRAKPFEGELNFIWRRNESSPESKPFFTKKINAHPCDCEFTSFGGGILLTNMNGWWYARCRSPSGEATHNNGALRAVAWGIVTKLRNVGVQTEWRDGDQTDRVFAWYEIEPLEKALLASGEPNYEFMKRSLEAYSRGDSQPIDAIIDELRSGESDAPLAETEKRRRVYYQNIVYSVCGALDYIDGNHISKGTGICCGSFDDPCTDVEARMKQLVKEWRERRADTSRADGPIMCGTCKKFAYVTRNNFEILCRECLRKEEAQLSAKQWSGNERELIQDLTYLGSNHSGFSLDWWNNKISELFRLHGLRKNGHSSSSESDQMYENKSKFWQAINEDSFHGNDFAEQDDDSEELYISHAALGRVIDAFVCMDQPADQRPAPSS